MSGLLDGLSRDFSRRIAVRRGMMAHLGLFPTEADCLAHRSALRETLIACSRCPNPDICEGWVAQNRPGTPMFCQAREAFLRLDLALAPARDVRRAERNESGRPCRAPAPLTHTLVTGTHPTRHHESQPPS